jgi:hypothetical protein
MATKRKIQAVAEPKTYQEYADAALKEFYRMSREHQIPVANHGMQVGDMVQQGRDGTARIEDLLEDGRIIHLSYEDKGERGDKPYDNHRRLPRFSWWVHVDPLAPLTETSFYRPRTRTQFRQLQMNMLLHTCYSRGLVDSPKYQRDYTWTLADKQRLIRSVFNRSDIGKFIFLEYHDKMEYEVVDGKQRLRALMDYYENRFEFEGKTYQQLSWYDKHAFGDLNVQITELDENYITESDILWLFLSVNAAGVPQTEDHLAKINQQYLEALKAEGKSE